MMDTITVTSKLYIARNRSGAICIATGTRDHELNVERVPDGIRVWPSGGKDRTEGTRYVFTLRGWKHQPPTEIVEAARQLGLRC